MQHSVTTSYIHRKAKVEDGSNSNLSLQLLGWARRPEEGLLGSLPLSHTDRSGSQGPQAPLYLSSPRWGEVVGGGWLPAASPPSLPLWAGSTESWGFTITCSNSTVSTAPAFHPLWWQQGRPSHRAEAHVEDGHGGGAGVWGFPGSVSRAEKQAKPTPTICTAECLPRDPLPTIGSTPNRESQPHHQSDSRPRHWCGAGGTHRLRSVPGRYWENRECSSGMSLRSHHRFSHRSPGDAGHDEQDSVSWKENRLSASQPQTPSTIGLFPPKQSKDRDRIPWNIHIHWQWNYIS